MIKKVRIEDAVGMVLGHDMTKIVAGEFKGPAFKKGHIIRIEDLPHLKDIGKEHIYLIELASEQIHENEAVSRIARVVAGSNVIISEPAEGRVNIIAASGGLLKISREAVNRLNDMEHVVVSTLHSNRPVKSGDLLAAVKIIPLVIDKHIIESVEELGRKYLEIITVIPTRKMKIALVITGNEVYYGRIQDKFASVFAEKAAEYGATLIGTCFRPDDSKQIAAAITEYKLQGADVIIATGGMSVDPDDVTPEAIRSTGAQVVTYGTPVLPGAMFMLAYLGDTAVMGMPGCGMFAKTTVFDLVFMRILAGDRLSRQDITTMGYGGLCLSCALCTYPQCPFGK